LLIIAALFFLPLVLAWLMHTGAIDFRPNATRNLGQLVQPPVPVGWTGVYQDGVKEESIAGTLAGHWLILYAVPQNCEAACMQAIVNLRQIHRAAGRQQSRFRLALLHDFDQAAEAISLQDIYGAFRLLENPDGSLWRTLEDVASGSKPAAPARGSSYLIDPLGNIMLFYAAGYDPSHLKDDLKRLLTWSKLDEQS
jgi:cytochrome oxidase Cu insertion factor (SCO1/SenC/PrrC family)